MRMSRISVQHMLQRLVLHRGVGRVIVVELEVEVEVVATVATFTYCLVLFISILVFSGSSWGLRIECAVLPRQLVLLLLLLWLLQ